MRCTFRTTMATRRSKTSRFLAVEKSGGEPLANSFALKANSGSETLQYYTLSSYALKVMVGLKGERGVAALLRAMRENGLEFTAA